MTTRLSADYHKRWAADAEPELRRIVRERDETIRQLRERIAQLEENRMLAKEKAA
jgi:hypothetical protein